jgi:hypothetical protein
VAESDRRPIDKGYNHKGFYDAKDSPFPDKKRTKPQTKNQDSHNVEQEENAKRGPEHPPTPPIAQRIKPDNEQEGGKIGSLREPGVLLNPFPNPGSPNHYCEDRKDYQKPDQIPEEERISCNELPQ